MEEPISYIYEFKAPRNARESTINTIMLLLDELIHIEQRGWTEVPNRGALTNSIIKNIKRELNNLEFIEVEE